jgi:8-oxo-dGTP pyrophosphatase MutT (NUDIX family)
MRRAEVVRQSGVIPYRFTGEGLEVLMVRSASGTRWVVPKGDVACGLTPLESAVKEAYEEAGVVGVAGAIALGSFRYVKRRALRVCDLYPLAVAKVLSTWPEMGRDRLWMPPRRALECAGHPGLDRCIEALCGRLRLAALREAAA